MEMYFQNDIGILLSIHCFIVVSTAAKISYKDYEVWQVDIRGKNVSQEFIKRMNEQDVWHKDEFSIDFLLDGNETTSWDHFLGIQNITYKILLKGAQKKIDEEILMKETRRKGKLSWTSYPRLNEIYDFLHDVASPDNINCTLSTVGKTDHRRDIKMIKLSNGNRFNQAILIVGGVHGREWTSVVSVLYFIDRIARNFSQQPSHIRDNDWYIIPVLNPDGYEYSMTKDRFWKKNRRIFSGPCDGVDVNRNFDYNWCQRGASSMMCSPNYCGIYPFSEAESVAIRDLILGPHFLAFISVHSYGRMVLFPWAMETNPTRDVKEHIRVTKRVADAMRAVDRQSFRTGSVSRSGVESGSGMAIDWAYSQGVVHSYIIETRGEGIQGYFLEPSHILVAAREVYAGLEQFAIMM